ncbi:MAG TPA: HD-GYP domain-containing protein [Anaerovoracaceae bacterium]|nr:HD-GYP domain-containing protein [Anaerovoracaceae bacterium]
MKIRQKTYILLIMSVGVATLVHSFVKIWEDILTNHIPAMDIVNWIIMLILIILCRALPVYIAKDKSIEISFVPVVASAMMYGFNLTIILFFLSTFFLISIENGKVKHQLSQSPIKELFNTSNIIVSIFIGGLPLLALGGYGDSFTFPNSILPASIFAVVTIAANLVLFIFYFVSGGEARLAQMITNTIFGIWPNVLSTIPLGIFIAVLLNLDNGSFFVLLFILPLLLARYSFKLYWDSHSMHMRTITALTRAIDAKDSYTSGHSERVADFAKEIACYMGLSKKMIADIHIAALIHDIGKIGIQDSILNKPGELNGVEFEEIKKHPIIGSQIIEEIQFSKTIVDAVLFHHCNYDGSGYPCGNEIPVVQPLPAAILSIADAYDAMTSDRPYRKRMTDEEALKVIRKNSGTQFNPDVVDAFCKIIKKKVTTDPVML